MNAALSALNVATPEGVLALGSSLAGIWSVLTLLPTLAVAVRRLRDSGRSWANLFWLLLPIAGLIVLVVQLAAPPQPSALQPPRPIEHPADQYSI